jgi:hypothetical protein
MPHPDPFDLAAPDSVSQWIQGVADKSKYLLNANLFERRHKNFRHRLSHPIFLSSILASADKKP